MSNTPIRKGVFYFFKKEVRKISRECSYLLSVECENCGKIVTQSRTQYKRAKHHYCSNKCQQLARYRQNHEIRICPICGTEFDVTKKSTKRLCSPSCQKEWQKLQVGEKNPRYCRKEVACEVCGKKYTVKKYKTENGQHLFCSTKCRQYWYANIFSQQEWWKEKSRNRALKNLENGNIDRNTKLQRIINEMLKDMNVMFVNEKIFDFYAADNYLIDENLIIEVMGDFWHCNPTKPFKKVYPVQIKRIKGDKTKHDYIRDRFGIEILYLWEDDIYNHPYLCRRLIKEYIKTSGKLVDYNSFNYRIKNNKLLVNENIIPYPSRYS